MQALPGLFSTRLEESRSLWETTHKAAYSAAAGAESDLAAFVQAMRSRLGEAEDAIGSSSGLPGLHDRVHTLCGWADGAAARLPRVRSGLTRRGKRLARFRVVLFGRTQAGKSTIREALLGDGGETIGEGAQRTTRSVREYDWGDCVVVDTPGIGAYQAGEDREQALAAAESADIVLFVISSDGLQEDTFEGLAALRSRNIPVVFALNMRRDLTKAVYRRRFLADPASVFRSGELDGHIARIQRLASERLGIDRVAVHPVHAQAAHMGVTSDDADTGRRLRDASRLDDLIAAMSHEVCERAVIRRLQTTTDAVVCPLDEQRLQAREHMRHLQCEREALELLEREVASRTGARWTDGRTRALHAVEALVNTLRGEVGQFMEEYADSRDIAEQWQSLVERYDRRMQAQVRRIAEKTLAEVRTEAEALVAEMAPTDDVASGSCVRAGPERCRTGWQNAARWLSRVPAVVLSLQLPPLIKASLTIVTVLLPPLLEPPLRRARARMMAKLHTALREYVESWGGQAREQAQGWFAQGENVLRRQLRASVGASVGVLKQLEQDLWDVSDSISNRVRELNQGLIASVAGLLGIPDTGAISRVARQPGRCTWIVCRRLQDETSLRTIGDALGEETCPATARTRAQRVAALFRHVGLLSCRVSVVNGMEARVVLRDGLRAEDVDLGTIVLAEDLTDLRVTVMRED